MLNIVKKDDGTYDFDLGFYHFTNVPEWLFEKYKESQTFAMIYFEENFLNRKSLTQKAREMRW